MIEALCLVSAEFGEESRDLECSAHDTIILNVSLGFYCIMGVMYVSLSLMYIMNGAPSTTRDTHAPFVFLVPRD